MENIPKKIYLQIDADGETPEDFKKLSGVTWSSERINDNYIEYFVLPDTKVLEDTFDICFYMKDWCSNVIAGSDEDDNPDTDKEILAKCDAYINWYKTTLIRHSGFFDYLYLEQAQQPCSNCQGGGCPVCCGTGHIQQNIQPT